MLLLDDQGRLFGKVSVIDAGIVLFLLCLGPGWHYAYRSLCTWDPVIVSVGPPRLSIDQGGVITIYGKNFQRYSTVKLEKLQLTEVRYYPPDRLEARVPPRTAPGRYSVSVTNPAGSVAVQENAVTLIAEPRVTSVSPHQFKAVKGGRIAISGKNLYPPCSVRLGSQELKDVESVSLQSLVVRIAPGEIPTGKHNLSVTNAYGVTTVPPTAIESMGGFVVGILMELDDKQLESLAAPNVYRKVRDDEKSTAVGLFLLPRDPKGVGVIVQLRKFYIGSSVTLSVKGLTLHGTVVSQTVPPGDFNPEAPRHHD